jgi:hypothetical protein
VSTTPEQDAALIAAIRAWLRAEMAIDTPVVLPPPPPTGLPKFFKMPYSCLGPNFFDGAVGLENPNYKMPLKADMWKYWADMGVNIARVAFKWKWIQPVIHGELDSLHLQQMREVMRMAADHGMHVLWNMHDYGTRDDMGGNLIGSMSLPRDYFTDVWRRLASQFAGDPNVAGYGLMNEPPADMPDWPRTVQEVIDAIRTVDFDTPIVVGGVGAGHAWEWFQRNGNLAALTDPNKRLVFEAHQYPDQDSSGTFHRPLEEALGQDWVRTLADPLNFHTALVGNFLAWISDNRRGIIGETGIPSGMMWLGGIKWGPDVDYRAEWTEALRRMLNAAAAAKVPTFIWTDGIHAEQNKLYVGHQAPMPGPVAEMLREVVRAHPRIA